ncbi:36839_t:CDS:2, partial [Gigaspora margarita]
EMKQSNKPTIQILSQARNVNLCDFDNTGYYPEEEDTFVTPAQAQLHFAEKVIYLIYRNKTTEVPISTDSRSLIEVVKELFESKRIFDEFKYDDETLEEAEGFYTEEISNENIF